MTDSSAAPPALELQSADLDKCLVHSRLEIASLLSQLCKHAVTFTATFGTGGGSEGDFILTSLLAVRPASDELIAEFGANADANRRALSAARLTFVAWHEGIKIQFSAEPVSLTRLQGRDAFIMPLPVSLLRLQRREYFRVTTPAQAVQCIIGSLADFPIAGGATNIVDISCGGIGISYRGETGPLEVGSRVKGCRILLPDANAVTADTLVKSIQQTIVLSGAPSTRLGCEFVEIAERDRAPIQRYINKVERERNRLR